jgi:hypothetical protein
MDDAAKALDRLSRREEFVADDDRVLAGDGGPRPKVGSAP